MSSESVLTLVFIRRSHIEERVKAFSLDIYYFYILFLQNPLSFMIFAV
jgi:hypothetical protein